MLDIYTGMCYNYTILKRGVKHHDNPEKNQRGNAYRRNQNVRF